MPLHLTKVAVGCPDVETLAARLRPRIADGRVFITTRHRPKRADELAGGSLFWIIGHTLVCRQALLELEDASGENGRHCRIHLDATIRPVRPRPLRAHQGWRYLNDADAPDDLGGEADADDPLPPALLRQLSALGLI